MTPDQHNLLTQLVQQGLDNLANAARAALLDCAPPQPTVEAESKEEHE